MLRDARIYQKVPHARRYLIIVSVRCLVHRADQLSEAYMHSFFGQQKVVKNPLDAAVR